MLIDTEDYCSMGAGPSAAEAGVASAAAVRWEEGINGVSANTTVVSLLRTCARASTVLGTLPAFSPTCPILTVNATFD